MKRTEKRWGLVNPETGALWVGPQDASKAEARDIRNPREVVVRVTLTYDAPGDK